MSEPADDLRRRVERVEHVQSDMQALLRENVLMTARLNETLLELKEELRMHRTDMNEIHAIRLELANLKMGFSIGRWVGATLGGAGLVGALAFLFKGHL